ncbi:Porphobilinogen deaminase [Candidatus Calditenuaceae archaeon HR02]|nr:Porphobilinogen deaminase [Candidatus Calditenuaceae archaeon HR02]
MGTRRSRLAVIQAETVAALLKRSRSDIEVEIVKVAAEGDEDQNTTRDVWGKGAFVGSLQRKCVEGEIDAAVHSLKDLPLEEPGGLVLASVPLRDDPRDALITRDGRKLGELRVGAVIGTSSERRALQLKDLRRDLKIMELRGNVDTRVRKVLEFSVCDGAVVSYAALKRLGLGSLPSEVFDVERLVPAPGQGAIAVECRRDDEELVDLLRSIDDPEARFEVNIERRISKTLSGGCRVPVGVNARVDGSRVKVVATITKNGGVVRASIEGPGMTIETLIGDLVSRLRGVEVA